MRERPIALAALVVAAGCGSSDPMMTAPPGDAALSPADLSAPPDLAEPARPKWPTVPMGDGVELKPLELVTVVAENDALGPDLIAFGEQLVKSSWWMTVAAPYGLGPEKGAAHVTGPAITKSMNNEQMVSYIRALVDAKQAPAPDGGTVYVLYLPDGIVAIDPSGPNTDCDLFEGYHSSFGDKGDNYAIVQRCYHDGPMGLDDVTSTASHEVIESATDPDGSGWALPVPSAMPWLDDVWRSFIAPDIGAEVADLCPGTQIREGKYAYERVWSNAAAATGGDPCIPVIADPYFNVVGPAGWQKVAAGGQVAVPLVAWSTAPMGDWTLDRDVNTASDPPGALRAGLDAARSATVDGMSYPVVNDREVATLTITAPPGTPSGTWATFSIYSTALAPMSDRYHAWIVGAYVP